jgi:hypothetical protein
VITSKERLARQREITDELGSIAYAVYRQWWRVLRNRRLRQRGAELVAESEELWDADAIARARYGRRKRQPTSASRPAAGMFYAGLKPWSHSATSS